MKKMTIQHLTTAAVVGAAYAVLSLFGSVFGVTFGTVQCRFSEALCVLPFFFPETVWGLFAGCLITNLLSPYGLVDIVVGSLATLLAAFLTSKCGKKPWPVTGWERCSCGVCREWLFSKTGCAENDRKTGRRQAARFFRQWQAAQAHVFLKKYLISGKKP